MAHTEAQLSLLRRLDGAIEHDPLESPDEFAHVLRQFQERIGLSAKTLAGAYNTTEARICLWIAEEAPIEDFSSEQLTEATRSLISKILRESNERLN